ncbi:M56 family metallopeptidase [Sphingomonas sinipercae]|uniref:M56 family metallopeptidase n=1 Tax=Sphingomonas sinipercae TaxID=2714944 RepID=A0A6G7ZNF9_9SPHN|nr:M56 family metallopeptidase [Sphingomonas sinipercae]QIL02511.1 M56 family metallopeptidase [Sphingomonas sinipercae]
MDTVVLLAAKSFLVAGAALLLLRLMRDRSAADRSWIAHLALAALLVLPLAAWALPSYDVAGPSFLVGEPQPLPASAPIEVAIADEVSTSLAAPEAAAAAPSTLSQVDWPFWGYVLPAGLLMLLTAIALGRLFVLKARATVLVEPHWLTALARAQQRMGFKHGTALLTSDELPSPISWGVVRPVILLNRDAANSRDEAEAIITHELAHVARLDWAKLMISRLAVALFWFNPLVWLLAREAHQLREEAADDAVLAADIEDTDYAKLLVGVARHECRGLLIGAHGVAPGRNSLSRRIKRVLDVAAKRAPGGWRWTSAAGFFAAGMSVPVAALNLVAPTVAVAEAPRQSQSDRYYGSAETLDTSSGTGGQAAAIAQTAAIAETAAAAAEAAAAAGVASVASVPEGFVARAPGGASVTTRDGRTVLRNPDGATVTIEATDRNGRRRTVLRAPGGAMVTFDDVRRVPGLMAAAQPLPRSPRDRADRMVDMAVAGVTPAYAASIRAAAPQLRNVSDDELIDLKALGVNSNYIRDLAAAGFKNLNADSITDARGAGLTGQYVREIAKAGYANLSLDELTEMRAVGVTAAYIRKLRAAGYSGLSVDKLVELRAVGVGHNDAPDDDGG